MAKKATIKITSDTSEAESGINRLTAEVNKLSSSNQQNLGGLGKFNTAVKGLAKSFGPATLAVGAAVGAVKKLNQAVKETTEVYKAQAKAEKQLEVAAGNNPYLDAVSVQQLKSYASELQNISTVGDEQLLPMMAQLAAAGRTQSEIQDIMKASLDVSASGAMSLESAVKNLNKTFSGLSGELGESIPQIKNLTKEQLKSGEAVKVIAEQYKGMAEETAKATGSSEQWKNAVGDYKELWGETFEETLSPMRRFFTELLSNHTAAKKAAREYKNALKGVFDDDGNIKEGATESDLFIVWDNLKKKVTEAREAWIAYKEENGLNDIPMEQWGVSARVEYNALAELQRDANKAESAYRKVVEQRVQAEEAARREAEAQAEIAAAVTEAETKQEQRDKLRKSYADDLEKTKGEIEARRRMGEEISEEAEAQELLNVAMQHYITMYSDPAFDRSQTQTGIWEGEQAHLDYIEELKGKLPEEVEELNEEIEEVQKSHEEELIDLWQTEADETIEMQKQILDDYAAYLDSKENLTDEEIELRERLRDAQKNINEQIAENEKERNQKSLEATAQLIEDISDYVTKFAGVGEQITDLARQNSQADRDSELSSLSEDYTNGLISYEEYCQKKGEIEKKAAKEEYKIRMWEWSMSFLQATANVAAGIAAALTKTPPASYVMAALTAASGAAQIATITASKPKPPAFASGGVVGGLSGATMGGDNTYVHARHGEMFLNAQQQRNLWDLANGKGGSSINMPVTINNTASDSVQASAQLSPDGLSILIEKVVSSQMAAGKYNESMDAAQAKRRGTEYF